MIARVGWVLLLAVSAAASQSVSKQSLSVLVTGLETSGVVEDRLVADGVDVVFRLGPDVLLPAITDAAVDVPEALARIRSLIPEHVPRWAVLDVGEDLINKLERESSDAAGSPSMERVSTLLDVLQRVYPRTSWSLAGVPRLPLCIGTDGRTEWSKADNDLRRRSISEALRVWQPIARKLNWLNPVIVHPRSTQGGSTTPGITEEGVSVWKEATLRLAKLLRPDVPLLPTCSPWSSDATQCVRSDTADSFQLNVVEMANRCGASGIVLDARELYRAVARVLALPEAARDACVGTMRPESRSLLQGCRAADLPRIHDVVLAELHALLTLPQSVSGKADASSNQFVSSSYSIDVAAQEASARMQGPLLAPYTGALRYRGTDWDSICATLALTDDGKALLQQLRRMADVALKQDRDRFVRPMRFEDIPKDLVEQGSMNLPNPRRDIHQLAQIDTVQTSYLMNSGTCLAVVARLDGNTECLQRCLDMLAAVTSYRPLQRPGNTYGDPKVPMVEGGDGVWLATGWGISGIVDMLTILGDRVPVELRSRLRVQLREEVFRIIDDWRVGRPWFVRSRKVVSNQWIEPTVGLIQACLFLGDSDLLPAYNFGVNNLAATIRACGSDGAGHEGVSYSNMSFGRVHEIASAIRYAGDSRLGDEPFLLNNWRWFTHMLMPGGRLVNCFDSRMSGLPADFRGVPLASMGAAVCGTTDPAALPTLRYLFPRVSGNFSLDAIKLWGNPLVVETRPELRIPNFSEFPSQGMVVWRSAFEPIAALPKAWAIWIRGGSPLDNHSHRDQGQVSVYCGDRVVLMDCGTPEYSDPLWSTYYGPASGHSVLQVGPLEPFGRSVGAPVTVRSLGAAGGDVTVDCTAGFPVVERYTRSVEWRAAGGIDIVDEVKFRQVVAPGTEILRFHTGSTAPVRIEGAANRWIVTWRGTRMQIETTAPVVVQQQDMPDQVREPFHHAALLIRSLSETTSLKVVSHLELDLDVLD